MIYSISFKILKLSKRLTGTYWDVYRLTVMAEMTGNACPNTNYTHITRAKFVLRFNRAQWKEVRGTRRRRSIVRANTNTTKNNIVMHAGRNTYIVYTHSFAINRMRIAQILGKSLLPLVTLYADLLFVLFYPHISLSLCIVCCTRRLD